TFEAATVSIRVESDPNAEVRFIGGDLAVGPQQAIQGKAMILRDRASITKMSMPLQIGVYVGNERVAGTGTTFLGPTIGSK
ncbi:MAG: cytochrome c oxidase accessory protein CcoG, partial [Bacteroidetes bacterium]|nr:cytochrome c oxidase accessory protein CcoG [Bacteroidota bacterium]